MAAELETIRNGLNVGPEDQSLWFYHQYLLFNLAEEPGPQTIAPALTKTERESYIREEISEILDFLEDYQDIKWIYEGLIQYTLALNQLGEPDTKVQKTTDLTEWLKRLRELDPQRSGRWADLEAQFGLT